MKDALIYVQRLFQSCFKRQPLEANFRTSGRRLASSGGPYLQGVCRQFSLAEIKSATNNFHEDLKIGNGGIANVYKGLIDNGIVVVAVKRLATLSQQGTIEFRNEVQILCQLRHPNLISLIGFCCEEDEIIIVYEHMKNLSLYDHFHGSLEVVRDPLSWEQRLKICIGVARGLHYLHAGVKYAIIHSDVKSFNILLDENWNAKICDFGFSEMGPLSMSKSLIRKDSEVVKGTVGYLDPEYYATRQLTEKSDVYSFGAVLLEVLCARKIIDMEKETDQRLLTRYACKCIENGTINAIIDTYLEGMIAQGSLLKFVEIAYDCVRKEGKHRPSMGEVLVTLELALELQEKAQLQSHSH